MKIAARWDETIACVECGGWNARWSSYLAGHDVSHEGDLTQYCRDCKKVFDVMLGDMDTKAHPRNVRMAPEDADWAERRIWKHVGSATWWEDCPGSVRVHVGHEDTSLWLAMVEGGRETLYTVRVVGQMPGRLGVDKVDGWKYSTAYVNAYEYPGKVSLYLPKSRLELVDRIEL